MQISKSKFETNKTISADYIMHKIEKRAVSPSKFSIHTVLNITSLLWYISISCHVMTHFLYACIFKSLVLPVLHSL